MALVQEAFNCFDADASGTIDFEELGALLESQARGRSIQNLRKISLVPRLDSSSTS